MRDVFSPGLTREACGKSSPRINRSLDFVDCFRGLLARGEHLFGDARDPIDIFPMRSFVGFALLAQQTQMLVDVRHRNLRAEMVRRTDKNAIEHERTHRRSVMTVL